MVKKVFMDVPFKKLKNMHQLIKWNTSIKEFIALKASDEHPLPSSNKGSMIRVYCLALQRPKLCRHCLEAIQRPEPEDAHHHSIRFVSHMID